jgi:pyruvate,water dikinase
MTAIHWLGEEPCHEESRVGGKAASLSRLAGMQRVPPGFAIAALPIGDVHSLDNLGPRVCDAYRELANRCNTPDPAVAVRSSAIGEDGHGASFAGQHDTFLNIRGTEALLDAVQRCVSSAASSEALAYRQQHGLATAEVRMGVLVQELVPSDVAAVVFSANPITGDRAEVMINSSWGLGESIVGGTTTPDTFVVEKDTLRISLRNVAHKAHMTVMADHGTTERSVPDHLRTSPSLSDEEIQQIAHLALTLERASGHAVDVECAIARSNLYLLQCRPITTLG